MENIAVKERLFSLRDEKYAEFMRRIIPNVEKERVLGVRTPALRALAREIIKNGGAGEFISRLPHEFFEEDQLHAFILSAERDFSRCIAETERFLPFVDNWATCDQFSPAVFKKHKEELPPLIERWLASPRTYTVRFGIGVYMRHFLDADFRPEYPAAVAAIRSDEYYINMMRAWYFATALAKRYDEILPFVAQGRLDPWTHNKAIQKARESYRLSDAQKEELKTLKR